MEKSNKTTVRFGWCANGGFLEGAGRSGVRFSLFGSFLFGTPAFPVSEVPLQEIVDLVEKGIYKAKPAAVFSFDKIREAQRLMESSQAIGRIVVTL